MRRGTLTGGTVVGRFGTYALANALLSASKILLLPVLVIVLEPAEYGALGLTLTISSVLTVLAVLGADRAVVRGIADHSDDEGVTRAYAATILGVGLLPGVLLVALSLVGISFSGMLTDLLKVPFWPYIPLAAIIALSTSMYGISMACLQAQGRATAYVSGQFARFALTMGISLALLLGFNFGAPAVLIGEAVGTFLVGAGVTAIVTRLRPGRVPSAERRAWIRGTLAFGVPLAAADLLLSLLTGMDRFVLTAYRSFADVGMYVAAATVAAGLQLFVVAFLTAYSPFFFRTVAKSQNRPSYVVGALATRFVIALSCATFGGAVLGPEILRTVAPAEYAAGADVFSALLVGVMMFGLYSVSVVPLHHMRRTRSLPLLIALGLVVSLGANLLLVPPLGIRGASIAFVLGNTTLFLTGLMVAQKHAAVPYHWVAFGTMVACAALAIPLAEGPLWLRAVAVIAVSALGALFWGQARSQAASQASSNPGEPNQ